MEFQRTPAVTTTNQTTGGSSCAYRYQSTLQQPRLSSCLPPWVRARSAVSRGAHGATPGGAGRRGAVDSWAAALRGVVERHLRRRVRAALLVLLGQPLRSRS